VSTNGFGHLYIETHNWGKAVAFWQRLGFEIEFDTEHGSGMLRHPAGGPRIFLAEQSIEDPLATELYLGAAPDFVAPDGLDVVSPFHETHWGTKVMVIQDPDGHRFRIEAPADSSPG
jgi:catechol 2,3-dioxygenase-like lactoylglutathione lyase family enzyme